MDPLVPLSQFNTFITSENISRIWLIILTIILAAFFACAETAFSQANRFKLAARADAGNKSAKLALKIIDDFDNSIITLLICINVVHILSSVFGTLLFISLFPNNQDLATLLETIIITLVVFLFSEMIPKSFANATCDRTSEVIAIPMYVVCIVLKPISIIFRFIVIMVRKIFKIKDEDKQITEDDFQDIVEDIQEEGHLEEEESELIQNAVDFGDYTVNEVLTPVENMVCYNIDSSSRRAILAFLKKTTYSRIPVYQGSVNNIIGILHVKKYLIAANHEKNFFNLKSILTKPVFVKVNTKLDDLVSLFQEHHTHIAIVLSEQGDTVVGMLTMEDAIEKLVGDIDEKNPPKAVAGGEE